MRLNPLICVTSSKHHMVEQYRLSQHQVTGGTGVNILNNLSDKRITPIRGDRQKGAISGKKKSLFQSSEQNLCSHARAIVKNEWLSVIKISVIKRRVLEISNNEYATEELKTNEVNEFMGGVNEGSATDEVEIRQILKSMKQWKEKNGLVTSGGKWYYVVFKTVNRRKLEYLDGEENEILNDAKIINITETNDIINATTTFVVMKLSLRSGDNKQKERKKLCGGRKEYSNQ